ncbi:MAG: hypothetical protein CM15mP74_31530 [Halieaceae bacterium]|nr:MAG: hypothetical protein CM15mP74_31530 [Halieaceae bacterium]
MQGLENAGHDGGTGVAGARSQPGVKLVAIDHPDEGASIGMSTDSPRGETIARSGSGL